ncbi:hypothetical protein, partial [Ochrobactrum sp. SFR4]|uniref:hypothetical protein n=1 Tax=Ochrobactrum sp. SFR4 TaxID=2717368 RepID=UPI001C8B1B08
KIMKASNATASITIAAFASRLIINTSIQFSLPRVICTLPHLFTTLLLQSSSGRAATSFLAARPDLLFFKDCQPVTRLVISLLHHAFHL